MKSDTSSIRRNRALPMIEPELLGRVLASAADLSIVVTPDGTTTAVLVNPNAESMGNLGHWEGRPLRDFLTDESVPKLDRVLGKAASGEAEGLSVELNHRDNAVWQFPVRYTTHRVGTEGAVLLLGRDLRQVAESQQRLVQAQMALERGYEERREYDARYRVLMAHTRDAFVLVSAHDGKIRDLNAPAATLLGARREDLQGSGLGQEFRDRRNSEFVENLMRLAVSETDNETVVQTRRSRKSITITPKLFRAAGERVLICRLDPEETVPVRDERMLHNLDALFRTGSEAMVFTDAGGIIEAANEAFVELVDFAQRADPRGRNLADYLARGQIDMNVLLDNAARSGRMHVYSTKLTNDVGSWTAVEISVSYLNDRARPAVAFLIRDANRAEAVRAPLTEQVDARSRSSVAELVGSAKLKDIVAESTDVIEKLCIETALDLTRNNRAAAAEMLGLSRQSLYVKLRKFDLLSTDSED